MNATDQLALKLLREAIAEMETVDQVKVHSAAEQLRDVIKAAGDHGFYALALVGAELQVMSV